METKKEKNRFLTIQMATVESPVFKPVRNKDYISYGIKDDFPQIVIDLFDKCSEHNAIVTGKAAYVFGNGLAYEKTGDAAIDIKVEKFLSRANQFQSWNELLPKSCINFELIDGFYFQHIYGKNGKIVETYNLDFSRVRASECGKYFYYCEDWSDKKKVDNRVKYFAYNPNIKSGSCIRYVKIHRPSATLFGDTYSKPNYIGALSAIITDINIDTFFETLSDSGMTAQGMLSLFNGEPTEDEKRDIVKAFEKNYTGPKKAGKFMLNFVDPEGKPAEILNFSDSDLDKKFEILGKRLLQKIFTGHKVTNPILFGIMQEGKLGNRQELLEAWEHFKTTYIQPRQEIILKVIQEIAENNGVNASSLFIEELPPIGKQIPLSESTIDEVCTVEEKRKLVAKEYGVELSSFDEDSSSSRLSLAQKLGVGGTTTMQSLIIDQTVPPDQKLQILIGLYGVQEKKARKMLNLPLPAPVLDEKGNPIKMSAVQEPILEYLKACAKTNSPDEWEILEETFVKFDSEGNPIIDLKAKFEKFAEVLDGSVKEIRRQILTLMSGDPMTKPEVIAKQIGTDVEYVNEQLSKLVEEGFLEGVKGGFQMTDKGLNYSEELSQEDLGGIEVVFKYALSPLISGNDKKGYVNGIKPTSHDFCKEMMALSNSGMVWTLDDINAENNDFGTSVWNFRGGFTGHSKGDVTQFCNHVWKAITRRKK